MSDTKPSFNNKKVVIFAVLLLIVCVGAILFLGDTTPKKSRAEISKPIDDPLVRAYPTSQ